MFSMFTRIIIFHLYSKYDNIWNIFDMGRVNSIFRLDVLNFWPNSNFSIFWLRHMGYVNIIHGFRSILWTCKQCTQNIHLNCFCFFTLVCNNHTFACLLLAVHCTTQFEHSLQGWGREKAVPFSHSFKEYSHRIYIMGAFYVNRNMHGCM